MKRLTPTVIEIDLEALRFNYRQLKKKLPSGAKTLCVVKSDAYGHGAQKIAKILQEEGTDFFGTGTIDEGVELREAGVKKPILILLGLIDDHLEKLGRYQLTPVIYDLQTAGRLNEFLLSSSSHAGLKSRMAVHVKVDTGMTRLGVLPQDMGIFCTGLKKMEALEPKGMLTHLADSDDRAFTHRQTEQFAAAREEFERWFPSALYHLANSQAAIDQGAKGRWSFPSQGDWMARLGIALYGIHPLARDEKCISLKPVLRWHTQVISLKRVPAKTCVSYGRKFCAKKESLIGVLPVGYADGYPRKLSDKARILVRGRPIPQVGTICMDMMMVDLTSVAGARVGDEAVLIGRQGREEVSAADLADWAETIPYEIVARISARVPKIYSPT